LTDNDDPDAVVNNHITKGCPRSGGKKNKEKKKENQPKLNFC